MSVRVLCVDSEQSNNQPSADGDVGSPFPQSGRSARIYQIQTSRELTCHKIRQPLPHREAVCSLCEKMVSTVLDVPLSALRARTRMSAEIALARQIAMYLAHTTFSLPITEVGMHFNRDRTTVAHACMVVEDKRDSLSFEVTMCQLESILREARYAIDTVLQSETHASMDGGDNQ